MKWKLLNIESKEEINEYLKGRFITSDLNFTNLLLWSLGEETKYKIENNVLTIKGNYLGEEYYYMPIPKNGEKETIFSWKQEINSIIESGRKIVFIPEECVEILKDGFLLEENRDSFDYVYETKELMYLKGRKYSRKKNKVNSFNKKYDYVYEKITKENIKDIIEFQKYWYNIRKCFELEILKNENLGIMYILENFEKLDICGGMIKIDGKIIAYSIGEKLGKGYGVIHIEKGLNEYIGSYQIINQLTAQNEFTDCEYLNREDDFGDIGLRHAKKSYLPVKLLKKYIIRKAIY